MFSGLYRFAHGELNMLLITCWASSVQTRSTPRTRRGGREGAATYPRLEVDEDGARDVVLVVGLVEKHVLAIAAFRRPLFEDPLFVDPVFGAEPLPVHGAHLIIVPVSCF